MKRRTLDGECYSCGTAWAGWRRGEFGYAGAFRRRAARPGHDQPRIWLHVAAAGLCALAGAAAAVSLRAQYRLVYAARHLAVAAALEAAIPDAAALVFACLGVALALHGRHAVRARLLNVASAGASVFMNVIAAAPGWRDLAVWAMPPAAYALASDTLIGVVRAGAVARPQHRRRPAAESPPSWRAVGGLALWLLRLTLAPVSTLAGFRAWVIEECPVAPGRLARPRPAARSGPRPAPGAAGRPRGAATKTARFLALVTEQHGPLAADPAGIGGADLRRARAPGRPERRGRPDRAAPRRARRPERRAPMIIVR